MKIIHISAVYREWPIQLVVQTDADEFLELSLTDLKEGDFEFDDNAWKQLVEDYRVFQHTYR
jgi:hypothetical protein